jgi:hypothetical protein
MAAHYHPASSTGCSRVFGMCCSIKHCWRCMPVCSCLQVCERPPRAHSCCSCGDMTRGNTHAAHSGLSQLALTAMGASPGPPPVCWAQAAPIATSGAAHGLQPQSTLRKSLLGSAGGWLAASSWILDQNCSPVTAAEWRDQDTLSGSSCPSCEDAATATLQQPRWRCLAAGGKGWG